GRRLHRSRRKLLPGRQARRGEKADAGRARNRPDLRAGARPAAQAGGAMSRWRIGGVGALFALAMLLVPGMQPAVDAELPNAPDDRYAGLQWRFVRIKYHFAQEGTRIPQDFYGEPWGIDAPAAEQNLARRIKTATAIQVDDPILTTLDDPRLDRAPVTYIVEPWR